MKEKLTHNLGLKIMALIFAAGLWLISININDPVSPRSYTMTVQLLNMKTLTSAGKYVEVIGGSDDIRVTVRASRSVFNTFSEKNLVATADVREMTDDYKIPINITTTKTADKIESIKSDSDYVTVRVEDVEKIQLPIEVDVQNAPAESYILGGTTTDQNAVIVSGPESVVSQISSAVVEINVDSATRDVNMSLPVRLYDADGMLLADADDAKLTKSVSSVSTTATIYQTKSVPIEYEVSGDPREGYLLTGEVNSDPDTVLIAGKANAIKNVSSIVIAEPVDVSGADGNVEKTYDIRGYLPENIILADSAFDGVVTANVMIERAQDKMVEIDSNRIHIVNVPEGYEGKLHGMDDTLELHLVGLSSALASIDDDSLTGTVDVDDILEENEMTELEEGNYDVDVTFELPEHIYNKTKIRARVTIEKVE